MYEQQQSYGEESLIRLQPVPKSHSFMKKMARIQAIDREIRKKWIKIKRENEKQGLTTIEQRVVNPIAKIDHVRNHTEFTFDIIKDHSPINNVQTSLKREKIINNHRRQQEIFYGRKDKSPLFRSPKNEKDQNINSPKKFISVGSSRRKIQSEKKSNVSIKQKQQNQPIAFIQKESKNQSPEKYEDKKSTSLSSHTRNSGNVPFMLEKIKESKRRQKQALSSKSQRQLMDLSTKNRLHMKEWASQRKDMFQKIKGSRAYYIMKSPTRLLQADNMYIF